MIFNLSFTILAKLVFENSNKKADFKNLMIQYLFKIFKKINKHRKHLLNITIFLSVIYFKFLTITITAT